MKLPKKSNYIIQVKVKGRNYIKELSFGNNKIINDGSSTNDMYEVTDELYQIKINDVNKINFKFITNVYENRDESSIDRAMVFYPIIMENEGEVLEMNRVLNINHDIFNCNHINYLPKISWDYKNIKYENLDSPFQGELGDEIRYGVEVFDNDNQDDVYYLEWDIKDKETQGDIFRNTWRDSSSYNGGKSFDFNNDDDDSLNLNSMKCK